MTTLRAHFDGRVLIPDEPVDLPVGLPLSLRIVPLESLADAKPPLAKLADLADQFAPNPDMPRDAAAQHDHYLYGSPKRP